MFQSSMFLNCPLHTCHVILLLLNYLVFQCCPSSKFPFCFVNMTTNSTRRFNFMSNVKFNTVMFLLFLCFKTLHIILAQLHNNFWSFSCYLYFQICFYKMSVHVIWESLIYLINYCILCTWKLICHTCFPSFFIMLNVRCTSACYLWLTWI